MIAVCKVSDVPLGEGRALTIRGRRIALFHTALGWFALDDACPHRGGPLSDGILSDRCVTCPLHDRRFELATGAALTDGEDVMTYRVKLRGQIVLLELDCQSVGELEAALDALPVEAAQSSPSGRPQARSIRARGGRDLARTPAVGSKQQPYAS